MQHLSGIRFGGVIATAAQRHGLDPTLLAAVAAQETGGPDANSGRNVVGDGGHGRGLFQIDDRYHAFAATSAAMNPAKNANYAAAMLKGLIGKFGGDVHAALSSYNAGSPTATGTKTTWSDGTTLGYADSVLRHARDLGSALGASGALRDGRADDASAVGGLAAAARAVPAASTLAPGLTSTGGFGGMLATALAGAFASAGSGAAPSSAAASAGGPSATPATPETQQPYRSYQSEMQAASSIAADADSRTAAIVDSSSDVFSSKTADA